MFVQNRKTIVNILIIKKPYYDFKLYWFQSIVVWQINLGKNVMRVKNVGDTDH